MVQRQKGVYVGEMLKDLGLLSSDQQQRVLSAQNAEFLSKIKDNTQLSADEKGKLSEYLDPRNAGDRSYEDALNAVGVRSEVKKDIRVKRYGQIATDLGFVTKDQVERVNALQASDRMNFLSDQGLGKTLSVEKGKAGSVDARTQAVEARKYIDQITSEPPKKGGFVSPDPLTRQAQAAGALSKALYSAVEVGGQDVDNLKSVQEAKKAVKQLANLYKIEAAEQYKSEGANKTANTLSNELKGVSFPEKHDVEKKSAMQKLWDGIKNAFKAIKKGIEKIASWVTNGFKSVDKTQDNNVSQQSPNLSKEQLMERKQQYSAALLKGTHDALGVLSRKHNHASGASISPDSFDKGKQWIDKQAGRVNPSGQIER